MISITCMSLRLLSWGIFVLCNDTGKTNIWGLSWVKISAGETSSLLLLKSQWSLMFLCSDVSSDNKAPVTCCHLINSDFYSLISGTPCQSGSKPNTHRWFETTSRKKRHKSKYLSSARTDQVEVQQRRERAGRYRVHTELTSCTRASSWTC